MNAILNHPYPRPWLELFRADPATQLDELLRGLAWVPPYERATPSEILKRLFGALNRHDTNLNLLDENLRVWLETRWMQWNVEQRETYGLPRFVTEYTDALSVIWLLELPVCGAWLQANYFELARWAAPLRLSKFWDLPRALAQAAALTQRDQTLRLYWLGLCGDAALASRRILIDAALSGLSNLPDAKGHGASQELIAGLARFGAGLEANPRNQTDFLRRWRSLKVRFPRTSNTWHKLWHTVLDDSRYQDKPFRQWLLENDDYLQRRWMGGPLSSHLLGNNWKQCSSVFGEVKRKAFLSQHKRLLMIMNAMPKPQAMPIFWYDPLATWARKWWLGHRAMCWFGRVPPCAGSLPMGRLGTCEAAPCCA